MRKLVLSLFLSFLLCAVTLAQDRGFDSSRLSKSGGEAYDTLLKTNLFAIGGVGFAGTISGGEIALKKLIEDSESVEAFKSLVVKATPEGGLYALLGLRATDCDCFDEQVERYLEVSKAKFGKDGKIIKEKRKVTGAQGCILIVSDGLSAVNRVESGVYDYVWLTPEKERQKLDEIRKKRKKKTKQDKTLT